MPWTDVAIEGSILSHRRAVQRDGYTHTHTRNPPSRTNSEQWPRERSSQCVACPLLCVSQEALHAGRGGEGLSCIDFAIVCESARHNTLTCDSLSPFCLVLGFLLFFFFALTTAASASITRRNDGQASSPHLLKLLRLWSSQSTLSVTKGGQIDNVMNLSNIDQF